MTFVSKASILSTTFIVVSLSAHSAHATKTVTSPYVNKGEAAVEWKGGYEIDGDEKDAWESEVSTAYGVTDFWETEIGGEFEDAGRGEDLEFTSLVWENKFQLAPKGVFFIDPGLKVEYAKNLQGEADEIQAKLLLAKQIASFSNIANLGVARELGEDSGDDFGYSLSYALIQNYSDNFQFGAEWYSDFGDFSDDFEDQGHQVGPVVYGDLFGGLSYQAGVLFGVTDSSPDALVKTVVEYEF